MNKRIEINFADLGMPVFTGRPRGEAARARLALDTVGPNDDVLVRIPDGVYTITSSYFLGLFAPSVKLLGGREGFLKVFKFDGPAFILNKLDDWIERALRDQSDIFGVSQ